MQKLFFEDAWERTISKQDHDKICDVFSNLQIDAGISFTFLWEAVNHHGDLLVTTLIHNNEKASMELKNIYMKYVHDTVTYADYFTVPIVIPAHHSMPWTFIFTKQTEGKCDDATYVIKK